MARREPNSMSFIDHLEELRGRIIRCLVAVAIATVAAYVVEPRVLTFLISFLMQGAGDSLALLAPFEGFMVKLKLSLIMGLIVSSPVIFWQFWRFVSPGLYRREKRVILPIVILSTISFLVGAAIAFYIMPVATEFFQSFASNGIRNTWSLSRYIDLVSRMILAFGLLFEMPLVIYFLSRLGLVTPKFLWEKVRYAIVIILFVAAVVTPGPDIFSQLVLAIPLTVLYLFSILLSMIAVKQVARKASQGDTTS